MADMMTPQQHYDEGMKELGQAVTVGETDPGTSHAHAGCAQAHFQAGLLSAVLAEEEARKTDGP